MTYRHRITLVLAAAAALGQSPAQAAATATVTRFEDSVFATVGNVTESGSLASIAAPPTSSTAHNYQRYNTGEEVRMYAVATTSPNTNLGFAFGQDGYASYTIQSMSNNAAAPMSVGINFNIDIQLTNTEASWQDLTLQARSGMRYSMYTVERAKTGGGLDGAEYMRLAANYQLTVDGSAVWSRVLDLRMDNSGNHPYSFLSNINPPNATTEPLFNIALGTWAPLQTRTVRFSFVGGADTNADATTQAFISLAPIFNAYQVTTAAGLPPAVPEPGTWALMLAGLVATAAVARRRQRG